MRPLYSSSPTYLGIIHDIILTFILILRFFNLNIKFDDFPPLFTFNLYISMKYTRTNGNLIKIKK